MDNRVHLKQEIEKYIIHKNKYTELLKEVDNIRKEKNNLEDEIYNLINILNLNNKRFIVNETKIQHKSTTTSKVLSIKFLKLTLEEYKNKKNINLDIEEFIQFLQNNREKINKNELVLY